MPGLTVTEKEHWKDRIGRRIDKRIESIAAEEPNLLDRVHRESHQRALRSLGLAELHAEKERIEEQHEALEKREFEVEREMLAKVRGVPVESIEGQSYRYDQEVNNAIERRQAVFEDELLAESEPGRRILQFRLEKENLLDTIWIATSPREIKTLWSKVGELLGDEQTTLVRDALAIEPVED